MKIILIIIVAFATLAGVIVLRLRPVDPVPENVSDASGGPAFTVKVELQTEPGQFRVVVPKADWEPIFFKAIDERAGIAKLPSLRTALPKDDLELRIWNGFGLSALEGFVLRRTSGNWTAIHVDGIHRKLSRDKYEQQLAAPKSGWNECWAKLLEMGILTLPDAAEIRCSGDAFDGFSYVVEINHGNTYRTYMYDNPSLAACEQAKKMIRIGDFIADEFNVPEMRTMK